MVILGDKKDTKGEFKCITNIGGEILEKHMANIQKRY